MLPPVANTTCHRHSKGGREGGGEGREGREGGVTQNPCTCEQRLEMVTEDARENRTKRQRERDARAPAPRRRVKVMLKLSFEKAAQRQQLPSTAPAFCGSHLVGVASSYCDALPVWRKPFLHQRLPHRPSHRSQDALASPAFTTTPQVVLPSPPSAARRCSSPLLRSPVASSHRLAASKS